METVRLSSKRPETNTNTYVGRVRFTREYVRANTFLDLTNVPRHDNSFTYVRLTVRVNIEYPRKPYLNRTYVVNIVQFYSLRFYFR